MFINLSGQPQFTEDDYFRIYQKRCEEEGLIPAIKHPDTGEIFTGINHRVAYENRREHLPDEEKTLGDSRRAGAKIQYLQGFIDKDGEFLTRGRIEKMFGFRYSETMAEEQS